SILTRHKAKLRFDVCPLDAARTRGAGRGRIDLKSAIGNSNRSETTMSDQQLPKPPDFDSTEPDYDAVGRIANTWFALTVNDFFALPHEEQLRIAERAGVARARY